MHRCERVKPATSCRIASLKGSERTSSPHTASTVGSAGVLQLLDRLLAYGAGLVLDDPKALFVRERAFEPV